TLVKDARIVVTRIAGNALARTGDDDVRTARIRVGHEVDVYPIIGVRERIAGESRTYMEDAVVAVYAAGQGGQILAGDAACCEVVRCRTIHPVRRQIRSDIGCAGCYFDRLIKRYSLPTVGCLATKGGTSQARP